MINNSILCADAQVNYNLDIRVKHEHDRKRKMLEHENIIEQYGRSLLSKCAGYMQYFLSEVYTNSTRTKKAQVETAQCGRSMIEMLGVLAIVGVLSVGGIAGYSKAMTKFKINKTADQISQIVTNIRTLYAQQTTYDGLNTATAIQMGVTPDELGTGTTLTHSFAGSITIRTSNRLSTSSKDAFIVIINNLPMEACVTLATMDWGSNHSSGLVSVSVHTGAFSTSRTGYIDCPGLIEDGYTTACPGGSVLATPMSVTQAATACQEEGIDFSIKFR